MKTELVVQCWNWFYIIDCKLQQFESNNWSQAAHKDLGCCSHILAVTQQRDWPWAGLECTVSKVERVFHLTLLPIEGSGLHKGTQKKSGIISIVCEREKDTESEILTWHRKTAMDLAKNRNSICLSGLPTQFLSTHCFTDTKVQWLFGHRKIGVKTAKKKTVFACFVQFTISFVLEEGWKLLYGGSFCSCCSDSFINSLLLCKLLVSNTDHKHPSFSVTQWRSLSVGSKASIRPRMQCYTDRITQHFFLQKLCLSFWGTTKLVYQSQKHRNRAK